MEDHNHRVRVLVGIRTSKNNADAILAESISEVVSPIAEGIGSVVLEDFSFVYVT